LKVEVIADVCYDFLRVLNLNVHHHDRLLGLSNAVLTEHIADNQVYNRSHFPLYFYRTMLHRARLCDSMLSVHRWRPGTV